MQLSFGLILLLSLLGWWISTTTTVGLQLGMTLVGLLLGFLVTNLNKQTGS